MRAQEFVCRTVETMVGPVQLERPYFYCRLCRVGYYPFDEALGVVAGCKQLDMQQAVVDLVTEVPYDTAQSLFCDLTGMACGSERMHTVTNQVGEKLTVLDVAPSREEILRRIASVSAGRFRRPVLVLGIDGAYVPTRPTVLGSPRRDEGTRGPSGRGGGDSGVTRKGCASICLMVSASSLCSVGIKCKATSNSARPSSRSKRPA